jgi:hypothetical protein
MNAKEFALPFFVFTLISTISPNLLNYFYRLFFTSSVVYINYLLTYEESILVTKSLADFGINSVFLLAPLPGLLLLSYEGLLRLLSFYSLLLLYRLTFFPRLLDPELFFRGEGDLLDLD